MKADRVAWMALVLLVGGCAAPDGPGRDAASGPKTKDASADAARDDGGAATVDEELPVLDENAPVEIVEEKYPGGSLWKRAEGRRAKDGTFVADGLTTTWYESGTKWSETTFRKGIKHGPRRTWYTTGAEWSVAYFSDGIEDGTWMTYHPNGEKAREWHIDRGVWNGTYTEWHPNGRKRMEVTFVDGLRQGVMTIYNEQSEVAAITDFIDGVEQP